VPESVPGRILAGLRTAIGVGAWVAPETSGRLFGLDPDANPQSTYVGRLFASRDAALAAGYVATDGDARRFWWQAGVACDLLDAVAGVLAVRRGDVTPGTGVLLTGTALLAAALGAAALAADDV
jgi:hypothetical protein